MIPVAVDSEPTTLNVMSQNLENKMRTVELNAPFVTNAIGFAGDFEVITEICESNGMLLLEDNYEVWGWRLVR